MLLKRPVKINFSRAEISLIQPKRTPWIWSFPPLVTKQVVCPQARRLIADPRLRKSRRPVLQPPARTRGAYNYQNIDIEGYAYYPTTRRAAHSAGSAFRRAALPQSAT
jgi:hypothetical protein